MSTSVFTGAAQGAAAGATFGPVGAVVGGAIGAVTGIFADQKAKEARRFMRKANALRTDATILRSYAEQRTLLRQAALACTTGLANSEASGAELDSSGAQGIQASIRTQSYDNFLLGQSILNEQLDANRFEAKAGAKMQQGTDLMDAFGAIAQLTQLIPVKPKAQSGPSSAPSLQNAFDTSLVNPGGIQTVSGNPYNA